VQPFLRQEATKESGRGLSAKQKLFKGDRMRTRCTQLLLLVLVVIQGQAFAQQDKTPSDKGKKVEKKNGASDIPAPFPPAAENWAVLTDLKTGLQPMAYADIQHDERPDFVRELVRVEWRIGDPIDLWIIRPPKVSGKVPVILYLYSYTDVNDRFHDDGWCKRAVADGFAAVGFVSALTDYRYKARPMKQWFVSELPEAMGSSVHDVQLILNYLGARGDMDMDHVGMFGMGSGGAIAILAAQVDSRIKTLDVLDPWGDWADFLEFSPVVPDAERPKYLSTPFLISVAPFEPLAHLQTLKTPNFRVQQTLTDPVSPKIVKERFSQAMPHSGELVKYENAGELLRAWKTSGLSGWIKQQLRSPKPNKEVASAQ
jgi:hypothetical protein